MKIICDNLFFFNHEKSCSFQKNSRILLFIHLYKPFLIMNICFNLFMYNIFFIQNFIVGYNVYKINSVFRNWKTCICHVFSILSENNLSNRIKNCESFCFFRNVYLKVSSWRIWVNIIIWEGVWISPVCVVPTFLSKRTKL